jgi:hypothetical protein
MFNVRILWVLFEEAGFVLSSIVKTAKLNAFSSDFFVAP